MMKHVKPFSHAQLLRREAVFNGMVTKGVRAAVQTLKVDVITAAAPPAPTPPPPGPPPTPYTPQALAAVTAAWNAQVAGELFPFLVDTFTETAASTAELTNAALGLSLDPLDDAWAANYLAFARNRLVGIGDALWRQMSLALETSYAEGSGILQMAQALQQTANLTLPRALTIARTEVISAANAGGFQQLVTAGFTSDECFKEWLATDDVRTREAHHKADGQTVGLLEAFDVGGEGLAFPGDPHGSPGNVINCRCSLAFGFADDAAPQATNVDDMVTAAVESWYDPHYLDIVMTMSEEQLTASSWGPEQEKQHPRANDGKFAKVPGSGLLHTLESLKAGGGVKAWTKVIYTTKYEDGHVVAVKPVGKDGMHIQMSWDAKKKSFKLTPINKDGQPMDGDKYADYLSKVAAYNAVKNDPDWYFPSAPTPAATSKAADETLGKIDKALGKPPTPGSTTKPSPPSSPGMSTSILSGSEPGAKMTSGWLYATHMSGDVIGHADADHIGLEKQAIFKQLGSMDPYVQVQYKDETGTWQHYDTLTLDQFYDYNLSSTKGEFRQDWKVTDTDGNVGTPSAPSVPTPATPAAPAKLATPAVKGDVPVKAWTKVIYTTKYADGTVVAVHPQGQTRVVWNEGTKKFELQAHDGSAWHVTASFGKGEAYKKFSQEDGWHTPAVGEGTANLAGTHAGDAAHAPNVSGSPAAPTITSPAAPATKTPKVAPIPKTVGAQLQKAFGDTGGFSPDERAYILTTAIKGIPGGQQLQNLTHDWITDQQAFYALANRLTALHQDKYPNLTLIQLAKLYDEHYGVKPGKKSQLQRMQDYLSTPGGKAFAKKYAAGQEHFNPLATGAPPTPEQVAAIQAAKKAADEAAAKAAAEAKKKAEAQAKKLAELKANFPVASTISTPEVRPADAKFETVTYETAAKWYDDARAAQPGGKWTAAQNSALKTYTGSGYHSMNGALRHGGGSDETWKKIADLQGMMHPVPQDLVTFRGSSHDVLSKALGTTSFDDMEKHVGAIIQDEGFMSTSIGTGTAFGGAVRYEVQIPKGSAALFVSPNSTVGTSEQELLLAAGTRFQIIGVRKKGQDGATKDTVIMRVVKA